MTGQELHTVCQAHGWTAAVVARAVARSKSSIKEYWRGDHPVPPDVAAWAAALRPVPRSGAYLPTRGGLRFYVARHQMRLIEMAAFTGAAESTVSAWLSGARGLPLPIRAWLAAGAPPAWDWGPAGVPCTRYRPHGQAARPGRDEAQPPGRRRSPTAGMPLWARRMARQARPRSARRKGAAA